MPYIWLDSSVYEIFPCNAVWCSKDKTGLDVFMGQYKHENSVLLAKIIPQKREAFVAYNGKEIPALNFKVLVSTNNGYQVWTRVIEGHIPSNGVICGSDRKNNKYLVGRTFHKGYLLPGYVDPISKVIHIAYKGKEYKYTDFEVLLNTEINADTIENIAKVGYSSPVFKNISQIQNVLQSSTLPRNREYGYQNRIATPNINRNQSPWKNL